MQGIGRQICKHLWLELTLIVLLLVPLAPAQQPGSVVPTLVNFSGTLVDINGKPISGLAGVSFYLYKDQQGGAPLWIETQNIQPDKFGHYTVTLGATKSQGLPTDLFASGEARWLGVQAEGQSEQPRVMLLAVPYALKAGDAQTVGGLPPSAFVLAPSGLANTPNNNSDAGAAANAGTTAGVTGSGTANFVPLWTSSSILGSSVLFQSGSGSTAMLGLNETSPLATLDVNGTELVRGLFESATTGNANASKGFNSNATDFEASSFNSGTSKAVLQHFEWQAEPAGNNTSTPGATLNLLFGSGTNTPGETGLKLSNTGVFAFVSGQTFPGTGTITGVGTPTGSGLTGGGSSGTLALSLLKTCATNQTLQWNGSAWACATISGGGTITGVTAGTDLTGGGTTGDVTLNLDTTKVPQLNAANTFSQPLTVTATVNTGFGTIAGNNASSFSNTSAVVGNATYTGSASTIGVQGYSQSTAGWGVYGIGGAAGVYGGSTLNGVFGNSTVGNGVYGQTAGAGGSGVYGTNSAGGIGVAGEVPAGGTGVYGENQSTTAGGDGMLGRAHTSNGNGVHGINDATLAVGVYGENSATNGYGVYGHAPNGYGIATDSNASQARSMGGWAKAMVYVNPLTSGIQRCFNSQLPGSQATTVPCGMTYTYVIAGEYKIDLGFQVDDRFLQATTDFSFAQISLCLDDTCSGLTPNQVYVLVSGGSNGDAAFFLTIF
jgi:hypothetical protein